MNKSVSVTGSSRRIGKAIALHCRNRREDAEEVARSIAMLGRAARALQFDISVSGGLA
jgi:3-oxoacyl-[acyl-carrier protein] reductase